MSSFKKTWLVDRVKDAIVDVMRGPEGMSTEDVHAAFGELGYVVDPRLKGEQCEGALSNRTPDQLPPAHERLFSGFEAYAKVAMSAIHEIDGMCLTVTSKYVGFPVGTFVTRGPQGADIPSEQLMRFIDKLTTSVREAASLAHNQVTVDEDDDDTK